MDQSAEIVRAMRRVAKDSPILNDGSFAGTILWQIYEAAEDLLECNVTLTDGELEALFAEHFRAFYEGYPSVMHIDG